MDTSSYLNISTPKFKIPIPSNLEIENKNQHFQLFRVNIVEPSMNFHFIELHLPLSSFFYHCFDFSSSNFCYKSKVSKKRGCLIVDISTPKFKIPIPSNLEILEENKNQHFQLFRVNIVEPSMNLHFVTICTRKNETRRGEGDVRREA